MAGTGEEIQVEIGLEGGQGLQLTTESKQWDLFEGALAQGNSDWVKLVDRAGAEYRIAAQKVGYVRMQVMSKHVGFRES